MASTGTAPLEESVLGHARDPEESARTRRDRHLRRYSPPIIWFALRDIENVLVSVYLPTRNRQGLLARAVASVLEQTHRDLELIVVNDGSTDASRDYLEDVKSRDARVSVVHNAVPLGAPQCRNLAITAASGEFVTGLDDDDRFHPGRLSGFVAYWATLDSIGEPVSCLYSQDRVETHGAADFLTKKPGSAEYRELFRKNSVGNQVYAPRSTFLEAGLFDPAMPAWQDLDLFIRMTKCRGPARLLDAALYILNQDPRADRISKQSRSKLYRAYQTLVKKHPDASNAMKQALLLQFLDAFYGFRIGFRDLMEFFSYGIDGPNTLALFKSIAKRVTRA